MMKLDAEGVHLSSLQLPVLQQFKLSAAPLPSTSQLLTGAGCPLPPTSGRQGTQAVGLYSTPQEKAALPRPPSSGRVRML